MSDLYKTENKKEKITKKNEENCSDGFQSPIPRIGQRSSIPSIQINNNEFHSFVGRRSSIPATLDNFNIHVYNGRRYSEVILSPTDAFRHDYFKFSSSPLTKINDCLSDVFGKLNKKFRTKDQVVQIHQSDIPSDSSVCEAQQCGNEMKEDEALPLPKPFKNPLEDSYEGNEKIVFNINELLEEDEEVGYKDKNKSLKKELDYHAQDTLYITTESGRSSRRNSDITTKNKLSNKAEELIITPSTFGSPVLSEENKYDNSLVHPKTSSSALDRLRRKSLEVNRPATRPDGILRRFPSQVNDCKQSNNERYQDNLRTIVLSYFHLTHPKLEHPNVNGTKHWERRSSRVTVHPVLSSIPRDAFGSRMSVIADEVLTNASANETDQDSLLKFSEIEYASGGLLSVEKELSDTIPSRPPDSETLLFSDGKRRIDMVLVYEEEDNGVMRETEMLKKERRRIFRENLEKEGLEFELEDKKASFDEKTYFLKIHAPWQVMTRYAELMNIKMPIKK